jgi:hypothetical protein
VTATLLPLSTVTPGSAAFVESSTRPISVAPEADAVKSTQSRNDRSMAGGDTEAAPKRTPLARPPATLSPLARGEGSWRRGLYFFASARIASLAFSAIM